jgi:hypothetical protein
LCESARHDEILQIRPERRPAGRDRLAAAASHAGLFDDDEARKALLDLRAKVEAMRGDLKPASTPSPTNPARWTW